MKRSILIIVLPMLLLANALMGQSEMLRSINELNGKYSIVRTWKDEVSVVYAQPYSTQSYFLLEQANISSAIAANVPSGVRIYDFEIVDDTVFFCGTVDTFSTRYAIVGCFGIDDLFNNGGGINYGVVQQGSVYTVPYQMIRPWRMDAYRYDGIVHIVMVGETLLGASSQSSSVISTTAIADVYYDGTTWQGNILYNKRYDEFYYTDITATQKYVVATATARDGGYCYLKTFYKSSNILSTPVDYGTINQVIHGTPTGKVVVDALDGDTCAVYYYYVYGNTGGSTLKLFEVISGTTPSINTLYSTHLVQSTSASVSNMWQLRDIRYNHTTGILSILQDMLYPIDTTTSTSCMLEYDIHNLNSLSTSISWLSNTFLFAIDQCGGLGFKTVGHDTSNGNELIIYSKTSGASTACTYHSDYGYTKNTNDVSIGVSQMDDICKTMSFLQMDNYVPSNVVVNINTNCQN